MNDAELKERLFKKNAITRSKWYDALARRLITFGGVSVILSVVVIVVLIVSVVIPLFQGARSELIYQGKPTDRSIGSEQLGFGVELGMDEKSLNVYWLTRSGEIILYDLRQQLMIERQTITHPENAEALFAEGFGDSQYSILWSDGTVSLVRVTISTNSSGAKVKTSLNVSVLASITTDAKTPLAKAVMRRLEDGSAVCVGLTKENRLMVFRKVKKESGLFDASESFETSSQPLIDEIPGAITSWTMDLEGKNLYVGTSEGVIMYWRFDEVGAIAHSDKYPAVKKTCAITAMSLLLGESALAVGDSEGGMSVWLPVNLSYGKKLKQVHSLEGHQSGVQQIIGSRRNRTVMSRSADGVIRFDYSTNEKQLLSLPPIPTLNQVVFSSRGNCFAGLDANGTLSVWRLTNAHPEVSMGTLFGKTHYENYDKPEYVWQSTGGEDYEPKLSVMPLVFGTLKGTFYAMLLAVPLALFGALYTSQFTSPELRRLIKPVVEIMSAIPSVVIGFLAALWLAPILEKWIITFFVSLVTLPLAFVAFLLAWQRIRRYRLAKRLEKGLEFVALIPVVILGVWAAYLLTPGIERLLFDGNFPMWMSQALHTNYDQRNCIIIAFGLGFAVIPIIFSISEDSVSNVPYNLTAASLALGASRWQTVWRVILPSASPGIFAAVMIGFGRAIGETMIVLMATGNTPIMDWIPFNGMRTLSANVAVEIPEAPVGGSLYRVLFLCAVILFAMTFVVNTAAELVRHYLRKKYGRF